MTTGKSQAQPSDGTTSDVDRYDILAWRREQVLKLRAKGYSIDAIVTELKSGHPDVKISHGTVINDIKAIKEQVNQNLSDFIQNEIPYENHLCLAGIEEVIAQAWKLADSAKDERTRISALSLVKDAYLTRQAVLGDSKVLEQAVLWLKRAKKQLLTEEKEEDVTE